MFPILCFVVSILLTILGAKALGVGYEEIPLLTFLVPVLWILPHKRNEAALLVGGMMSYAATLPYQPIALSIGQWILFPLLTVAFSKRSSRKVILITTSILLSLQIAIMVIQHLNSLEGLPLMTALQLASISAIWKALRFKVKHGERWWALGLIIPLGFAGLFHATVVALSIVGMSYAFDFLSRIKNFNWGKLLHWTVPTVGFAALVVSPRVEVPHSILVVWMCLLGTAWATDYILRSIETESKHS